MVILRLALLGTGTILDPYRIALPSYHLREFDAIARVALVDVPDTDLPEDDVYRAVLTAAPWERAGLPPRLLAVALDGWYAQLDTRYAEHAGRFRPTLA